MSRLAVKFIYQLVYRGGAMVEYTFKTYIINGQERYEYSYDPQEPGLIRVHDIRFPESLVSMAYLDRQAYTPILERQDAALSTLYEERTQTAAGEVDSLLTELGKVHIYFELLRVDWRYRLAHSAQNEYADVEELLPRKELSQIAEGIVSRQEQIRTLFASFLDMDAPHERRTSRITLSETIAPISGFPFHPLQVTFEQTGRGDFVEVVLPATIFDLMDYHLRECLIQGIRMRACKNCGKYFAVTGRSTAEYCNHPFDAKGRTCKEVAAILKWEKSRADDEVFKEYRREYKKRFARIKAGTIDPERFYKWSAQAREKKAHCEAGEISFEEFAEWLRQS